MPKAMTWLEIDAQALNHNINLFKKRIGNALLGCVVKGNAYGHGLHQIINITKHNDTIDWYCTGTLEEALYIRSQACTKPILVLYPTEQDFADAISNNISLVIFDTNQLEKLIFTAATIGKQARIHIKIDTGLSRFGFFPNEGFELIKHMQHESAVYIEGIFTHFAQAETEDQSYTQYQMDQFNHLILLLQKTSIDIPYKHAYASSPTLTQPLDTTNMVRIGAGMYGLWPSEYVRQTSIALNHDTLKPVLSLKTTIMSTRTIRADTSIGYGRTYRAKNNMRIGILPVGYADGLKVELSNKGSVLVNTTLAPIIGRIGMNCTIIDVTHIEAAQTGSVATVIGNQSGITTQDLAQYIQSFNPREITNCLGQHIKRVIIPSDQIHTTVSQKNETSYYQ